MELEIPISKVDYEHEVLSGLYFEEMHYRHDEIREAHKRTFEWVQNEPGPGFVPWLRQSLGIFWIRGKAGSGKSTLMKLIYDDPRTRKNLVASYGAETLLVGGFFFHDRGSLLQKSLEGVLQAVLYQILERFSELIPVAFPIHALKDKYRSKTQAQHRRWTHQELERALLNLVGQSEVVGNVCLFIDALDEYNGNHLEFVELIKTVAASTSHAKLQIKFCISSRPLNVFMDGFENFPGFQIHGWTKGDISIYVTTRLQGHPRLRPQSCGKVELSMDVDNLRREVIRRASGVFLWVKLVVDNLLQGLTDGDTIFELQKQLAALPGDLEGLYRRILETIDRSYLPDTFRFFDLVQCAMNPLSLLQFALATEPHAAAISCPIGEMKQSEVLRLCADMERRLRSRCGGLLEVYEIGRDVLSVQFLHQTVKDFLKVPENGRQGFGIQDPAPMHDPFVSLMRGTLLRLKSLPRDWRDCHRSPPTYWIGLVLSLFEQANHAEASTGKPQTDILDELDRAETEIWSSIAQSSSDSNRHWSALTLRHLDHDLAWPASFPAMAVVAGLVLYVGDKIRTEKVKYNSDSGWCLLHYAVNRPAPCLTFEIKSDMVKLLLESGASPMHTYLGVTAWEHFLGKSHLWPQLAVENLRIMQLFLDYGADPNVKIYWKRQAEVGADRNIEIYVEEWSPLKKLIHQSSDFTDPEIATLLLTFMERGADIEAKDSKGESVLAFAQRRSSTLATFLLEHEPKQGFARTEILKRRSKRKGSILRSLCFGP